MFISTSQHHPNTYFQKGINDVTLLDVNLLYVPVTSSSFQMFSSASFSQTSSICIISVWETVSHPCKTTSKILIFTLLAAAGNIICSELNYSKHSPDFSVLLTCVWMPLWFATIGSYPVCLLCHICLSFWWQDPKLMPSWKDYWLTNKITTDIKDQKVSLLIIPKCNL